MKNTIAKIGNVFCYYTETDHLTERRLELSLGHDFLNRFSPESITELGSVMIYQGRRSHTIVDLYDKSDPIILNLDGADYDYTDRNVLAISTIEHFDDVWQTNPIGHWKGGVVMTDKCFSTIDKIVKTSKNYLITVPIGIQTKMDESILKSDLRRLVLHRDDDNNWYRHGDVGDIGKFTYDKQYTCASAIHLITNIENYF